MKNTRIIKKLLFSTLVMSAIAVPAVSSLTTVHANSNDDYIWAILEEGSKKAHDNLAKQFTHFPGNNSPYVPNSNSSSNAADKNENNGVSNSDSSSTNMNSNSTAIVPIKGIVTVNNPGSYTHIVAFSGQDSDLHTSLITNRGLANNTRWLTDEYRYYNGHKYYRVATTEWVKDTRVTDYVER